MDGAPGPILLPGRPETGATPGERRARSGRGRVLAMSQDLVIGVHPERAGAHRPAGAHAGCCSRSPPGPLHQQTRLDPRVDVFVATWSEKLPFNPRHRKAFPRPIPALNGS